MHFYFNSFFLVRFFSTHKINLIIIQFDELYNIKLFSINIMIMRMKLFFLLLTFIIIIIYGDITE